MEKLLPRLRLLLRLLLLRQDVIVLFILAFLVPVICLRHTPYVSLGLPAISARALGATLGRRARFTETLVEPHLPHQPEGEAKACADSNLHFEIYVL